MANNKLQQKDLFYSWILDREKDYYEKGYVNNYEEDSHGISVDVGFSHFYNVYISLNNNKIGSLYCDCPHCISGNNVNTQLQFYISMMKFIIKKQYL